MCRAARLNSVCVGQFPGSTLYACMRRGWSLGTRLARGEFKLYVLYWSLMVTTLQLRPMFPHCCTCTLCTCRCPVAARMCPRNTGTLQVQIHRQRYFYLLPVFCSMECTNQCCSFVSYFPSSDWRPLLF